LNFLLVVTLLSFLSGVFELVSEDLFESFHPPLQGKLGIQGDLFLVYIYLNLTLTVSSEHCLAAKEGVAETKPKTFLLDCHQFLDRQISTLFLMDHDAGARAIVQTLSYVVKNFRLGICLDVIDVGQSFLHPSGPESPTRAFPFAS
jgi:hypothetical protein